ncbi:unnamed protein product, partial [Amoebophrya sp. A25]
RLVSYAQAKLVACKHKVCCKSKDSRKSSSGSGGEGRSSGRRRGELTSPGKAGESERGRKREILSPDLRARPSSKVSSISDSSSIDDIEKNKFGARRGNKRTSKNPAPLGSREKQIEVNGDGSIILDGDFKIVSENRVGDIDYISDGVFAFGRRAPRSVELQGAADLGDFSDDDDDLDENGRPKSKKDDRASSFTLLLA